MDFNKMGAILLGVIIITVALNFGETKAVNLTNSEWWSLANMELPDTNSSTDTSTDDYMRSFPLPLTKRQLRLVTKHQGVIYPLINGAKLALKECKFQYRNRRWNCPTMDDGQGGITFGNIFKKGYRETAFIHAITSAAVTYSVARGCAEGSVRTCTCSTSHENQKMPDRKRWGGCSVDVNFGRRFARTFLDSLEKRQDFRSLVNLYNNEAGRLHARDEVMCKCHGMTGDCSFFTCWKSMVPFRRVGDSLRKSFDEATQVIAGLYVRSTAKVIYGREKLRKKEKPANRDEGERKKRWRIKLVPKDPNQKRLRKEDLVYFEHSPNFCEKDDLLHLPGTVGRHCNATSFGMDRCESMCCGRGHKPESFTSGKHTCL